MLSVAVFTVPSRAARLQRLLDSIPEPIAIVTDPGEGHWPTAQRAWRAYDRDATHHLVLQDDIVACRDFIPAVRQIVGMHPLGVYSFFSFWKRGRELAEQGNGFWLQLRQCSYAQALCLPVPWIDEWLMWDRTYLRQDRWTDDNRLGLWCQQHSLLVHTTVPSLVQHEAPSDSVVDPAMNNKRRVSPYYFHDLYDMEASALELDWTYGFPGPVCGGSASFYRAMLDDRDPW